MKEIFENPAIKNMISTLYPGIFEVPEEDIDAYMDYCDSSCNSEMKNYQSFKMFRELKEKCRIKGIESIMFRKDVRSFQKFHHREEWNDTHDVDYDLIKVFTDYGTFKYTEDHRIL